MSDEARNESEAPVGAVPLRVLVVGDVSATRHWFERGAMRVIGVHSEASVVRKARQESPQIRWIHAMCGERLDLLDGCVDHVELRGPDAAKLAEAARLVSGGGTVRWEDAGDAVVPDVLVPVGPGRWQRQERTVPVPVSLSALPRRDAFSLFRTYGSPFFELTADVSVASVMARCRERGLPFHLVALHAAHSAIRAVPELMLRLDGDAVVLHPKVHIGSTQLDHAERVGFVYFPGCADRDAFIAGARAALDAGREGVTVSEHDGTDVVYFSNVPWVAFRSITHADTLDPTSSVPRLTFGRAHERGNDRVLPVSLSVHHGLADGLHVGWFFRYLEHFLARA